MVTDMNEVEKHAAFYRGYLTDDRSVASVAAVLATAVAVWLLFYLVSLVGPQPDPRVMRLAPHAAVMTTSGRSSEPRAAARRRREGVAGRFSLSRQAPFGEGSASLVTTIL